MLSHLKVVELASVLAGPDVGMFFAELGAKVIKIENKSTGGDVTRKWKLSTESQDSNISAYFSSVNWHKEHLFYNLKDDIDKQQVYQLIKTADIVIVNYKPGDDIKLGMDYNTIKKYNPTVIYGEINGYGKDSDRAAYDVVLQAETGYMSMNGTPTSGPIKMPIALIDVLAAHQLKEGILLALLKKEKTEKGSLVEVSLYDAALASLKNQATNWLMNQFIPQRIGSLHPNIAPYGETFETKDNQFLVLAIGSNKHFEMLLKVIDALPLLENEKYATNQLRVINRRDLDIDLQPYFKANNSGKLMQQFREQNIPVGIVKNMKEIFKDKKAQDLILEEEMEGNKTLRVKTAVFKISD
ncbi:MAG: CoA transferase [Vicingus serpentipes]|nr:CoA transferase [Vicingus serpentipes]